MKPDIELQICPAAPGAGNSARIEFYTQQRRIEFGKFLYETAIKLKQQKESNKK
jgi:predicted P-loop ATPase/GTPase